MAQVAMALGDMDTATQHAQASRKTDKIHRDARSAVVGCAQAWCNSATLR